MSYIINRTDGTKLTELIDGNIDQIATDLTLIGKSASSYGEYINENLVRLLENFSNTTKPLNPIQGQLWYDTLEKRLKIYDDDAGFKLTSGTFVASSIPSSIAQGDIWIDSSRRQLYFNDGVSTILAGPYDSAVTGFNIVEVLDIYGLPHTVIELWVGTNLFGIISNDDLYTPDSYAMYTNIIYPGLNLVNMSTITNIANPVNSYDAVNKLSMINHGKTLPLVVSADISRYTGDKNEKIIINYLDRLFPANEYGVDGVQGPRCKVICTDTTSVEPYTIRQFTLIDGSWTYQSYYTIS